jgi:hypothetical protein
MSSKVVEHFDLAKLPVKEKEIICQILDQKMKNGKFGIVDAVFEL